MMRAHLLIVLLACRSAPHPRGDGCIVSEQEASEFYGHSSDGENYFTPSRADIDAFQATLGEFLTTQRGTKHIVQNLARYRGVFVGIVVDGRRRVRGFYSCQGHETCRERSLLVFDGGDCYFDVDFDLVSRTHNSLYIHGHA